jgi:hypothetical protein
MRPAKLRPCDGDIEHNGVDLERVVARVRARPAEHVDLVTSFERSRDAAARAPSSSAAVLCEDCRRP